MNIISLTTSRPITEDDFTQSLEMRDWTQSVTDRLPSVGTGSPEGVVIANQLAMHMDDAGTAGNILYIKRDADIGGDRSQGWILV